MRTRIDCSSGDLYHYFNDIFAGKPGNDTRTITTLTIFHFIFLVIILTSSCEKAPRQPTDPSPPNNGQSDPANLSLCANIGGPMQVRYFGRERRPGNSNKFTIILLPDTQYYTEEPQGNRGARIDMLAAQTNWIVKNRVLRNIVYVGQLGDCVQNGDGPPGNNKEIEYQRFASCMATLENPTLTGLPEGIPFGACVGNHDETPNSSPTGTTTYFNKYLGVDHFAGRKYYGGHYGTNNDNHYEVFTASGVDMMVISLKFDQTPGFSAAGGPLEWADTLVRTNPMKKIIVMTHYAMDETLGFGPQGQAIYDRLKVYPNFWLMVCGHRHLSDGEARRENIYNGNKMYTMLSNYQARGGGGNGLLRILEFDPALSRLSVKTYSPYTDRYETDSDSEFELTLNMLPNIGEIHNGSSVPKECFTWNGLSPNTSYEWNMELYDGRNITVGPVWNFTTTARQPVKQFIPD